MISIVEIARSFKQLKRIRSIHLNFNSDGIELFCCTLSLKKGELVLGETESFKSLDDLGQLKPALPTIVYLSGRKVLDKNIDFGSHSGEPQEALKLAFPAIKPESVYFEVNAISNARSVVSVLRKDVVDDLIESWPQDHPLFDLKIGPFSLYSFAKDLLDGKVHVGDFQFDFEDETINAVDENQQREEDILGEHLNVPWVGAYLHALQYYSVASGSELYNQLNLNRKQWFYNRASKVLLSISLPIILVALLVSFLVFSEFRAQNSRMELAVSGYREKEVLLGKLKQDLKIKERFLAQSSVSGVPKSYVLDQLAACLPKELGLNSIHCNPVARIKKKEGLIELHQGEVIVKGKAKSYLSFRKWLGDIKAMNWVEDLEIQGYNEFSEGHASEFELRLKLRG